MNWINLDWIAYYDVWFSGDITQSRP